MCSKIQYQSTDHRSNSTDIRPTTASDNRHHGAECSQHRCERLNSSQVHERALDTDVLLTILKQILPRRPALRVRRRRWGPLQHAPCEQGEPRPVHPPLPIRCKGASLSGAGPAASASAPGPPLTPACVHTSALGQVGATGN